MPVEYFDERYTSAEAESLLLDAGLTKKRRKERLDQLAAQIMLTAYLEAGARGQQSPESFGLSPWRRRIHFGCGYLGHRVAKLWRERGDHTIAFTRSGDPTPEMIEARVFTGQADVTKPESLSVLQTAGSAIGGPTEACCSP